MSYEPQLTVSQEFFDPKKILGNIPTFVSELRDYVTRLVSAPSAPFYKHTSYQSFKKKLEQASPDDFREVRVFVPQSLKATFSYYLDVMDGSVDVASKLLPDVLVPFSRWLALGISDPSTLRSVRGSLSIDKFEVHNVDKQYSAIGNCFQKNSNVINKPAKAVFTNKENVKQVYNRFDELTGKLFAVERKQVIKSIQEISDNLELLIKRIEEDQEGYKLSNVSIELLSKFAYTIAQEVEFFGVVSYEMTKLNTALTDTAEAFNKAL